MRREPFLLPPSYHQRYFCYRRAYCAGEPLIPTAWYYVSPYNVPWLLLKPEGRQEARGKCRPQVIAGLRPEPANGVLGLRSLQRSNVDDREILLTEARKVCKYGLTVTGGPI